MKEKNASILVTIWQVIGIISIILLIKIPFKGVLIDIILNKCGVKIDFYNQISVPMLLCSVLFCINYVSSIKFLAKYKSTKMYSLAASLFMLITLISIMAF